MEEARQVAGSGEFGVDGGGPVLTIFAHPDDTEFVCGGTLALWASKGRRLVFAFCTDGSKGTSDPTMDTARLVRTRQEEQRAAAKVLGCDEVVFLTYPDALLEPSIALRRDLTRLIRQYRPETVVCFDPTVYWMGDYYLQHPDHRASGEAALAAVFPSARDRLTFPELLAEGLEPHSVEEIYLASPGNGHANRWVDVSSALDRKVEAMLCHKSQVGDAARTSAMLRAFAKMSGEPKGLPAAESFRVINLRPRSLPGMEAGQPPAAAS